jgi:hypothetical protein
MFHATAIRYSYKCPFGCNVTVILITAVAVGQGLYSGVRAFNWYYLSSPPQVLRCTMAMAGAGVMHHVLIITQYYV